jgi:hypothetical protein
MSWITSFLFLSAALYLFERNRIKLDWFQILVVALVPAIIGLLKSLLVMVVPLPPVVVGLVWLFSYPVVFLLLWKMMALPAIRAAAYTAALFVFDILMIYVIFKALSSAGIIG